MDRASDYNVDGGLLGLGEFIFLELLSEMELPQDAQQFLILNKKTIKLILHLRYSRIIQSIIQISPMFIIKDISQGKQVGNNTIHSDQDDWCTIAIDPIIREGIARIEIIFYNIERSKSIGIADASCSFAAGKLPWNNANRETTVRYRGKNGGLSHITDGTNGNQGYEKGQRVAVEVDMTTVPRRTTFFVNDVEQPNYVIGIPSEIRFWVHTYYKSSSFTVTKFERLIQSTAKGVKGSKALEWGKEWK
ncbi:MAG: hypothetical protein EZS28_043590 [Streblomastix strix]|uniref:SPRY domain-containing protein n=1 Tax=Streblomastix strix TaxID=222440 RepID=A0A5J4TSI1_9EUKA|nr:MAG: hypothetical protein EZS28_043590 [Streblomastix strix]